MGDKPIVYAKGKSVHPDSSLSHFVTLGLTVGGWESVEVVVHVNSEVGAAAA